MNESNTGKIVRHWVDLDCPRPLSAEEQLQLERLDTLRDEDIDFSDIPEITDFSGFKPSRWRERIAAAREAAQLEAVPGGEAEPTAGIGADVLEFFRAEGGSPMERINQVLRDYVAAHRKSA